MCRVVFEGHHSDCTVEYSYVANKKVVAGDFDDLSGKPRRLNGNTARDFRLGVSL